ncbi:MAG TPA: hypothetical protein VGX03_06365 [Candidatus Binatia bacterium]|jgi:hypothetical protein|nr:hypothetical protein [Candidatus Binatia bacterium]
MSFTEPEAKAKKGKRVRVRDAAFAEEGIPQGTSGAVVKAHAWVKSGGGPGQVMNPLMESWVVDVRFEDPAKTLIDNIGKGVYERSLEET